MTEQIINLKVRGRQLFHYQIKRLLGIPDRLPSDFSFPPNMLGNVMVTVFTREQARQYFQHKHSSQFYHRVIATCPECNTYIPAGKLQQHLGSKRCSILKGEQEL